ncbi:hypothetical protein QYS49_31735 [Marivirga salinae]|uniref:Outer membrane protein beta-barrel domain-containing protein n=1 Tax=Marivirga salinarum TaxID=3059078 RepID=A0AA51NB62_9BACT|nr:hypothetical protein [Marivirga sp. BDSF4-3]WMN11908.1 hypothetical protein QYS49_31735 [Marivirga sp. BDSF4-3]
MKTIFLTLGLLCTVFLLEAQEKTPPNIIVVESNFIISTHFSYDRVMTSVGDKSALTLGGDYMMGTGFGYGTHWIAPEINLFSFGPKHFLETGIQYAIAFSNSEPEADSDSSLGIKVAYRYQGSKGFIFRTSLYAHLGVDPPVFPTIGFGYAF